MAERARACIVLCAKHNLSDNWLLWDVRNKQVISRTHWTEQPISDYVIGLINSVAENDRKYLDKEGFESEEWHMTPSVAPRAQLELVVGNSPSLDALPDSVAIRAGLD
jgi:hypothetical protein